MGHPANTVECVATVGIVDDDPLLRPLLVDIVEQVPELHVVGAADTLRKGVELCRLRPDVMLIDLKLPDGDGTQLVHFIRRHHPTCKVLVLSVFADGDKVLSAIEAGADGYLLKGAPPDDVASCIKMALDGGAPISPAVATHILGRLRRDSAVASSRRSATRKPMRLTPMEVRVLESLAKGLSFKEVARVHDVSRHTITDHVKSIYRKLEVNSRGEAVFEGYQAGLLELPEQT